jgi:hypothetical protein
MTILSKTGLDKYIKSKIDSGELLEQKAIIQNEETPQEKETATSPANSYSNSSDSGWIIGLSVVGGIVFTLVLLIILANIFDWGWTFGQWMTGIVGGLVLLGIICVIIVWLEDELVANYYSSGSVILGIFIAINFILLLIFRSNYKIIFGCVSVLEIISGIVLMCGSFSEGEEGWGTGQAIETAASVILFIVAMIWL